MSIELVVHNIHDHGTKILDLWTAEVEKRTGGAVHFKMYTAAGPEITALADVIRDVPAAGGQYPLLDLIQTPFIIPNAVIGSIVLTQLYSEFPEMRSPMNDVKIVGLGTGALMALFTSKKWGPVRRLEDLKGARTRSLGPIDKAMEALGVRPLHVAYLEIAHLLETGELDATVLGLLPAKMFKLAEGAAPYCTVTGNLSLTMHPMRTFMKWESWNRLPVMVKRVIDELGPDGKEQWYARTGGPDADQVLVESLDYIRRYGELITLPEEEMERWKKAVRPSLDQSLDEVEKKGLPGRKFFARMLELVDKEL
jgi:TRAP-type transport system periplasmic protein